MRVAKELAEKLVADVRAAAIQECADAITAAGAKLSISMNESAVSAYYSSADICRGLITKPRSGGAIAMTPQERKILDLRDQGAVICIRCLATLSEYRQGQKCTAPLQEACPGFMWVEETVRHLTAQ